MRARRRNRPTDYGSPSAVHRRRCRGRAAKAAIKRARTSTTGTLLVDIGHSINPRTDAGFEIAWTPSQSAAGEDIRTTFIVGVAQFRPWASKGFSIKGGMGMAFVRNWVYDFSGGVSAPPFTSKALGLTYSAGWTFRHTQRVGVQIFGAQHVATLGDLKTSAQTYENVIANFWSVGAVLVFR